MPTFVERLSQWFRAILSRLKQRRWRTWAVVVGVGFIALEAIRAKVSDAGTLLLEYAFRFVRFLAQQPMGVGGLGFLLFFIVLAAASWLETRPRRVRRANDPEPLSDSERRLVQDLRTVWNRHGVLAVDQLGRILRDAQYSLKASEHWAELLEPIVSGLDQARAAFEASLEPLSHNRVQHVRDRFNEMYSSYVRVMKWVAVLQANSQLALGSRAEERLAVWRQNHRDMIERLRDLSEDPAHRGSLHIYMNFISDAAFRQFVLKAEMSPEWLNLMQESTSTPAD